MAIDRDTLLQEASCLICGGMSYADSIIIALLQRIAEGSCGPPTTCEMLEGAGSPVGAQTPDFEGQLYHDTTADTYWRSTGTTSADWVEISGGGVDNGGLVWGPSPATVTDITGPGDDLLNAINDLFAGTSYTELDFGQPTTVTTSIDLSNTTLWTSMRFRLLETVGNDLDFNNSPGLVTFVADVLTELTSGAFKGEGCAALTSVSAPLLATIGSDVAFGSCPLLTSLALPSLQTCGAFVASSCDLPSLSLPALVNAVGDFNVSSNANLVSFSAPLWMPEDSYLVDFNGCALDAASVNHILARCVASGVTTSTIDLSGGTNAAPTGQGLVDKADLITAGNTVTTN